MTNRKSTKRALLGSIMAMVLCLAMLVGATFAWFTDTASTGVNKIQAGNLDIEIQDETGKAIDTLAWATKDGTAFAEDGKTPLWEPGCTYTLTPFQIVNKGNLALKYKIVVTGLEGDAGLLKVIKFTYKTGEETFDMNAEGHLAANGGASKVITVSAHMDEAAGNEYMNKTLEGVKFTVYATQDTVESDSFNSTYDANATYPVANVTELKEALTNGGVVAVTEDIQTNNIEDTAALIPALRRLWHQRPEGRYCVHQRWLLLRRRYCCAGPEGYPHHQRRYLRLRAIRRSVWLQLPDQLCGQRLQEWYGEGHHSGRYVYQLRPLQQLR